MESNLLESAVPALYERFHDWLVAWLVRTRRVQDFATAEDVVQDCFVVLAEHPELAVEARNPAALLITMAANKALDLRRAPSVRRMVPIELGEDVEAREPEEQFLDEELAKFAAGLKAAMSKLTPRQLGVFNLRVMENLSIAEVADLLGLSKATVWEHYVTAVKKLRQELGGDGKPSSVGPDCERGV